MPQLLLELWSAEFIGQLDLASEIFVVVAFASAPAIALNIL